MEETPDYSKMSNEELLALYKESVKQAQIYNLSQQALKILINSLYGACGNPYFVLYDRDIARGITLMGQCFIRKASKYINEFVSGSIGETEVINRCVAGDTDSVKGDTLIYVNGEKVKISDYYDSVKGPEALSLSRQMTKKSEPYTITKSYENGKVIDTEIKYVMKHKVKKKLYKVSDGSKEVIVTEDHSLIVKRNGELLAVRPMDILETDELITL